MNMDERVDLGPGISARFLRDEEGREFAVRVDHPGAPGTTCGATFILEGAPGIQAVQPAPRVGVERHEPLTLDRPLGCARCGTVGWVVEGRWSDHGRRLSQRRHPATTWSRGVGHATTADVRPADPDRFVTEWIGH